MENESGKTELPSKPINAGSIEDVELRLRTLEKTEGRMFEIIKWAFGLMALFVVYNWWTGKTSYDRDKADLKDQVAILQKQLVNSQQELTDKMFKESSTNLQNQFVLMQWTNDQKWIRVATTLNESIASISASVVHDMAVNTTNINFVLEKNGLSLNQAIKGLKQEQSHELAQGYMAQADYHIGAKLSRAENYHFVSSSYLMAAICLVDAKDDFNFRHALDNAEVYTREMLKTVSKSELLTQESKESVQDELNKLIPILENRNTDGVFTDDINALKLCLITLKEKLAGK